MGGHVDYSWPGAESSTTTDTLSSSARPLALFHAATTPPLALPFSPHLTVGSLSRGLERVGLRADDFDEPARIALREMLTWSLPAASEKLQLSSTRALTTLVLSFGATADCRSVDDCPRPGPTNELLAATAEAFAARRWREHGQRVDTIAQWEVASAVLQRSASGGGFSGGGGGSGSVTAVGSPGGYENTAQIFHRMLGAMRAEACADSDGARVVLLAHPDHLLRALRIGETAIASTADDEEGTSSHDACRKLRLVPSMLPYAVDWPSTAGMTTPSSSPAELNHHNLYARVVGRVHTSGALRNASWYDGASHGFFPDGEQPWVSRRDVWMAYEVWARAKGVATGMIKP